MMVNYEPKIVIDDDEVISLCIVLRPHVSPRQRVTLHEVPFLDAKGVPLTHTCADWSAATPLRCAINC